MNRQGILIPILVIVDGIETDIKAVDGAVNIENISLLIIVNPLTSMTSLNNLHMPNTAPPNYQI